MGLHNQTSSMVIDQGQLLCDNPKKLLEPNVSHCGGLQAPYCLQDFC